MKTRIIYIVIFLSGLLCGQNSYLEDRIYVKLNISVDIAITYDKSIAGTVALTGISDINNLNYRYKCSKIERLFTGEDLSLKRWYIFYMNPENINDAKQDFQNLSTFIENVDLVSLCQVGWEPNDPLFNTTNHKAFYDSKIPTAWDIEQGNSNLKIGIIDNGLDWNHPDIAFENIWQNLGEDANSNGYTIYQDANGNKFFDPGDLNGIDNDGNGKIDDLVGYNFYNNNYNIYTNLEADQHGLNIFGIIAAAENNSRGAAGVSFNSKVIHCKAGSGGYIGGNWVQAIQYLANRNANVINMSFFNAGFMQSTQDVINSAYQLGSIIVACGGYTTSGCPENRITYPIGYDNVIGLGVLENDAINMRLSSIVSSKIDLLGSRTATYPSIVSGIYSYGGSMHTSGTTALTSGIISLLKAHYPTWTNDQIINQLFITAINKDDYNTVNSCNFNFIGLIGHGLVDAEYALSFNGTIDRDLIWNKDLKVYHNIVVQSGKTLTLKPNTNLEFQSGKTFNVYGNLIIQGNLTINQNINILAGGSIQISPGATITFTNNSSLVVNGVLNAIGTSTNKITFDRSGTAGTWGSITFNGSAASGSILDNVEIKYASDVKCLNDADVTIQNSLIDHCTQGIYVYNSQPQILNNQILEPVQNGIYCNALGKIPLIQNNTITKTSSNITFRNYQGIWLENHTSSYIAHNDISGFYWGIYVGGGSYGLFTNHSLQVFYPNNRIMNNLLGFAAGWGSGIAAGIGMVYCWNNSIFNNVSFDVYSYQSSSITAQYNYWGGSSPKQYVDGTSHLDVSQFLTSDPWGGTLALNSQEIINSDTYNSISPLYSINDNSLFSDIYMTINLETTGKVEEAINLYKKMLEKNSNTNFALTSLARIKTQYDRNDLLDYFITLSTTETTYKNIVQKILAGLFLQDNEYVKALNLYDEIIKSNQNNYEGVSARFEKFFAALNYKSDKKAAAKLLSEISLIKLTEEELISQKEFAVYLLYGSVESDNKLNKESNESTNSDNSVIANDYTLNQNYPNPFNPSTMINYSIKDEGLVKLIIYDILGREIASLVKEIKEAGYHSVEFNASQLPSGVYIYTLQVNGFSASRKMLLLK
jgi:tetratricopeptide (TPR) repeat protein